MAFVEKSCGSPSTLVNGVGYAFSRRVLTVAPAGSSLLEKEVFPVRLSRGAYAMLVHGFFVDIGIPTDDQRLQDNPRGWIARMRLRSGDLAC